jgi:hypothetical protein
MVGMNKFSEKDRRRERRVRERNHIAHDLHSPKYHQRVVENKRTKPIYEDDEEVE